MRMATVYRTNRQLEGIAPINSEYFTLEELENIVGDSIVIIGLKDEQVMVINGDGVDLPFNTMATNLYRQVTGKPAGIHGDVLVCLAEQVR